MGFNTPSRKQSFRSILRAKEHRRHREALPFDAVGTSGAKSPVTADAASLARILSTGAIPPGFSTRIISDLMLKASGSRIVSEHEGAIRQLLITVPLGESTPVDSKDARHFKTLLKSLGSQIEYVVVYHPRQLPEIEVWFSEAGIPLGQARLVKSPKFDYSLWAQDAYVTLREGTGTTILCESISFPRVEDMTIADDVAAQTDISALSSYLYFQGGNVLGGRDVTLMGLDYIVRNAGRFKLDAESDVIGAFKKLWGTPVLILGGELPDFDSPWWENEILTGHGYQPLFHIDMYVTPTGVIGTTGKPIVMLGSPEAAYKVLGRWNEAGIENGEVYDSFFRETEQQLSTSFEVKKVPLWLVRGNLNKSQWTMKNYVLTWNNSIVQNDGKTRKVLLPNYADPQDCVEYNVDLVTRQKLQAAAEDAWKEVGFNVSRMDGVEDLAYASGSVHCMTKVLKRA